ncbi:TnsD family Tn7-like transposition protein [Pseudomonas sp. P2757]|uniref:TnsD family Tn7-like transposition protein n=1 Tax=unclassified Pseudomonas TaxID=196821 RepID=UPI003B5BCAF3
MPISTGSVPASKIPHVCWLPGETFFSLCSRQHVCSGNVLPGITSAQMFGLSQRSIKHDLPYGMDAFEQHTDGIWGSADSILAERTILSFFAPFQSAATIRFAVATLKGNQLGSLKYRLGLVTGGFGAEHPLKGCAECLEENMCVTGIPYWRLAHQYPGVLVCPVHGSLLHECTQNRHWCGRFTWTVPSKKVLADPLIRDLTEPERAVLNVLADAVLDLAALGFKAWFDPVAVSLTYRQHLNAAVSFRDHVAPLRRFHPFEGLPSSDEEAASFVSQMTRRPRGYYHPLKHLLMITWLFGSIRSFHELYSRTGLGTQVPEVVVSAPVGTFEIKPVLSVVRGAPRPKKLKSHIRNQLIEQLAQGACKHAACTAFGVTISTVNKLLRAEPELKAAWERARFQQQLSAHRGVWSALCSQHPEKGAKALRACSPATFAWLYRNDRYWLVSQAAAKPKPAHARNSIHVDWAARDLNLKRLVQACLLAVYDAGPQRTPISKSRLFSLVPTLASCLENYNQYPSTREYVETILNYKEA